MKKCSLILFLLVSLASNGQNSKNVEDGLFKINALAPGASYEFGIAKDLTLNLDAFFGFALRGGSGTSTEFGLFPGLQADFRYFTNMKRRLSKGKNISGNSGNYLAVSNQFLSGDPIIGDLRNGSALNHIVSITYGIQRTRPKGFYWGFSVGPGLYTNEVDSQLTLFLDLRLGWVLTKRK